MGLKVHDDVDGDVVQATACSRRTKAAQRVKRTRRKMKRKRKRNRKRMGMGMRKE